MLLYGLLITFVGMGAVFVFLYLLMLTVQFVSKIIQKTELREDEAAVALAIVVSSKQ